LGLFKKKQAVNPAELLYIDYFDKRYGSMYPHEVNVATVMQIHKELIDTFVSRKMPLRRSENHNYFLDALERNGCPIHPAEFAVPQTVFILTNKVPWDEGYEDEVIRLQAEGKIPKDIV
jgi:hypothetical protein